MNYRRSSAGRHVRGLAGLVFLSSVILAQGTGGLGGAIGGPANPSGDCIAAFERELIRAQVDAFMLANPEPEGLPVPPTFDFFPQGGTVFQDTFIGNFVDLDPTPASLAWNCSTLTADGHRGSDCELRSFGEQVIGVPVFAGRRRHRRRDARRRARHEHGPAGAALELRHRPAPRRPRVVVPAPEERQRRGDGRDSR